jgi:hypothetical protein
LAGLRVSVAVTVAALVLLALVLALLLGPLRDPRGDPAGPSDERAELEAQREAKYREIRDAELDFRTGKLSRDDHAALDATLRAEALEILDRLERVTPTEGVMPKDASGERSR